MAGIGLAFKAFFRIIRDKTFADSVGKLLEGKALPAPAAAPALPAMAKPKRSEALSLLAVLQREGRLVDFLKEDLTGYNDAQIGAAVRDVHRDCAAAIERMFAPKAARDETEGASVTIPPGFDAARIRLTGNVAGPGPYRGALRHGGWEASKVEIPAWTGSEYSARIIAPAEVEVA
jgi:hypothetical protein